MFTHLSYEELKEKTGWLPKYSSKGLRAYCIEHNIRKPGDIPKCVICKGPTKWDRHVKSFGVFCSRECMSTDKGKQLLAEKRGATNVSRYGSKCVLHNKEVLGKIKKTMLERYGAEHPSQVQELQDKKINTFLQRFGEVNPNKSQRVKDKIKATNMERYGVEYVSASDEFKAKVVATNLEKYGVACTLGSPEVREKARQTTLDRYGVSSPLQSKEILAKLQKTNLEKYGAICTLQNDEVQAKSKKTLLARYGTECSLAAPEVRDKITRTKREQWYEELVRRLELKCIEMLSTKEEFIVGDIHKFRCLRCDNIFETKCSNITTIYCPNPIHKKRSSYEFEILSELEELGIKNILPSYKAYMDEVKWKELDLYLPDYNLGIEFHGLFWHSDLNRGRNYHREKYLYFKRLGIRVIQIFENEWLGNRDIVMSIIRSSLGITETKIAARKCNIEEVPNTIYKRFLEDNHLQGYAVAKVRLGLFYEGQLVAIQSYSKRRFITNSDTFEMIRFCVKTGTNVMGGFSKLLAYFKNTFIPKQIDSFIDLRYFTGAAYIKNGFRQVCETEPNYYYFTLPDKVLYNRMHFQKHKLEHKLKIFDKDKSEHDNMLSNKYLRIFDAGNLLVSLDISH